MTEFSLSWHLDTTSVSAVVAAESKVEKGNMGWTGDKGADR